MRIRNDRDIPLTVPSLHIQAEPGETVFVPAGTRVPDGFSVVVPPRKSGTTSTKTPAPPADDQEH